MGALAFSPQPRSSCAATRCRSSTSFTACAQALTHCMRQALREAPNLTRLVVTPLGALPALAVLDLTVCSKLVYLFLQCASLHTLLLDGCTALTKVWRCLRPAPCRALL